MIYVLLLMLLSLAVFCYVAADRDFISPCVIVPVTFFFCTVLAALYTVRWNLPMHAETCFVIVAMIAFFEIGAMLSLWSFRAHELSAPTNTVHGFVLPWKCLVILMAVLLPCMYWNYQEFWDISRQFTSSTELSDMIGATIHHMEMGDAEKFSRWYVYRMVFAQGAAFVCWFVFLYNMVYKSGTLLYNLRFILPMCAYLGFVVLTGGRQPTVYIAIFTLVVGSFLYTRKQGFSTAAYKHVILLCAIVFFAFFSVFYALGTLSGKIDETKTASSVLAHYAGTNISAFDVFLHSPPVPESQYIGTMTLVDAYAKLGKFFPSLPQAQGYIRDFVRFDGIDTNVYTALRRYIQDYGFIGCAMIMFILGAGYQVFYNLLKYHKGTNDFLLIAYGFLCYPCFLMCREERFMLEIISSRTVYVLIGMFLFYRCLLYIQKRNGTFIVAEQLMSRSGRGGK